MRQSNVSVGDRFGRWTIAGEQIRKVCGRGIKSYFPCRCDCGTEKEVLHDNLVSGKSLSCGCISRERATIHGLWKHPLYKVWLGMLQRCENPNHKRYKNYGGRGVEVSEEFHNAGIFINWCLENGWEPGLQLDRSNNDGNYERTNLQFSTLVEQANNTSRNRVFSYNGKTLTIAEWAREPECMCSLNTLYARILTLGWDFERALLTPVKYSRTLAA